MPRQGVASSFKFGKMFGLARGLMAAFDLRRSYVRPQEWQRVMECRTGGDKNVSKTKAQQLFPGTKVTHANADALLIAEYARRKAKELGYLS